MTRAIILEGPDEAGKSYLAQQLLQITDKSVISIGPHPRNRIAVLSFCNQFLRQITQDVIMDRCTPISELVYRTAMGGFVVTPNELWKFLESAHRMAHPVFVICMPEKILEPQVKADHDTPEYVERMRATFSTTLRLYSEMYDELAERGFNVIHYDYFNSTPEQLLKEIEKCPM